MTLPIVVALIWSLIALTLLAAAPTNQFHRKILPEAPDLVTLTRMSLVFAAHFILRSIAGLRTPSIILFIFPALISLRIFLRKISPSPPKLSKIVVGYIAIGMAWYLITVCGMAPFVYAQLAYPEPRALITVMFVLVIAMASLGWLAGQGLAKFLDDNASRIPYLVLGVSLLLGIISFYPLRAAGKVLAELPRYHKWASFWDARDTEIRLAKQQGILDVEVMEIDHIIPRVIEIKDDPNHWYNACAAGYYGMRSISANKPGWDD